MGYAASVKIANVHDHEYETHQGSDGTPRPPDGTGNWTEIATETETSTGGEMIVEMTTFAVTGMSSGTITMILGVGEMMAGATSAWQPDANSGTRNTGTGSAKRSAVPESVNETRIGIQTARVIETATAGSPMNVIHDPNDPMDATGGAIVETRTEIQRTAMTARIQGLESRKKSPLGWMLISLVNLARAFLAARPKTGSWTASKLGSWI
jgi:hypothetical protein